MALVAIRDSPLRALVGSATLAVLTGALGSAALVALCSGLAEGSVRGRHCALPPASPCGACVAAELPVNRPEKNDPNPPPADGGFAGAAEGGGGSALACWRG